MIKLKCIYLEIITTNKRLLTLYNGLSVTPSWQEHKSQDVVFSYPFLSKTFEYLQGNY